MQSVYERYTIDRERAETAEQVAVQNGRDVARLGVDVAAAQASIQMQVEQMAAIVPLVDPSHEFPFHGGRTVTMAGGWGNLLGELLAHGDDIARATVKPFTIPSGDLEIILRYTAPLLSGWLAPAAQGTDESWDLRFPFGLIRFTVTLGTFHHGTDVPPRPAHHAIEVADTAEWLLIFPYGRRPPPDAVVAHLAEQFQPL